MKGERQSELVEGLIGGIVTALRPLKGDAERVSIRIGKRAAGAVSRERLKSLGVDVGAVFDRATAERVSGAVAEEEAHRQAMKYVRRRMLGRWELEERLRRRGFALEAARSAVEKLAEAGLIDDEAYGRALLAAILGRRSAGPALLRSKLYAKRLDRSLVERLVSEAGVGRDEAAEARALVARKMRGASMAKLDGPTRYRRLQGMLARRGFGMEVIRQALRGAGDSSGRG